MSSLPFVCHLCPKTFKRKYSLQRHVSGVHDKIRHSCPSCQTTFANSTAVQRHITIAHPTDNAARSICHDCGKSFYSHLALLKHAAVHIAKVKCNTCFMFFRNIKKHSMTHTKGKIQCGHCSTTFSSYEQRNNHINQLHPQSSGIPSHINMSAPLSNVVPITIAPPAMPMELSITSVTHTTSDPPTSLGESSSQSHVSNVVPRLPIPATMDSSKGIYMSTAKIPSYSFPLSGSSTNSAGSVKHFRDEIKKFPIFCGICGLKIKSETKYNEHMPCSTLRFDQF